MVRHIPFVEGTFRPVAERATAHDPPVTGRVPRDNDPPSPRDGPGLRVPPGGRGSRIPDA
ncbi:hypothetical protein [Streptomyces sp. NPDC005423]|uniref:hypothetical protein n=1 Tax=Streptomyces sp. NPDC005423 TaxID=3155343 RepID=UPI0033A1648F